MFNNVPDEEWVKCYGSPRLRAAHLAGCLNDCFSSYIKERVAMEMPGWWWGGSLGNGFNMPARMREPSHELIEKLLKLQSQFPGRTIYLTVDEGSTNGRASFVTVFQSGYVVREPPRAP